MEIRAQTIRQIDAPFLEKSLPFILLVLWIYVAVNKNLGDRESHSRIPSRIFYPVAFYSTLFPGFPVLSTMNPYALAADIMVVLHLMYVSFTVGGTILILSGGILKWHWVRNRIFRYIHTGSVLLVAAESLIGIWCPLTVWEWRLRAMAGQDIEKDISFVGRLIRNIIFVELPDWAFNVMYTGFGLIVLAILLLVKPEKRKKEPTGGNLQ